MKRWLSLFLCVLMLPSICAGLSESPQEELLLLPGLTWNSTPEEIAAALGKEGEPSDMGGGMNMLTFEKVALQGLNRSADVGFSFIQETLASVVYIIDCESSSGLLTGLAATLAFREVKQIVETHYAGRIDSDPLDIHVFYPDSEYESEDLLLNTSILALRSWIKNSFTIDGVVRITDFQCWAIPNHGLVACIYCNETGFMSDLLVLMDINYGNLPNNKQKVSPSFTIIPGIQLGDTVFQIKTLLNKEKDDVHYEWFDEQNLIAQLNGQYSLTGQPTFCNFMFNEEGQLYGIQQAYPAEDEETLQALTQYLTDRLGASPFYSSNQEMLSNFSYISEEITEMYFWSNADVYYYIFNAPGDAFVVVLIVSI